MVKALEDIVEVKKGDSDQIVRVRAQSFGVILNRVRSITLSVD